PALESVLDGVIASPQFRVVFRKAAVHAHDLLFKRDRGNVILDLADAGLAVSGAAKAVAPDLAKHIPKDIKPGLLSLTNRDWATDLLDAADSVRFLGIVLPILGLLCLAGAVAAAPSSVFGHHLQAGTPAQRAWRLVSRVPERTALRALRAAGIFLVSLLIVLDPSAALEIVATVAGAYGIYYAVTEVLVLVERP